MRPEGGILVCIKLIQYFASVSENQNNEFSIYLFKISFRYKIFYIDFLAHLSQRLIGELKVYTWSDVGTSLRLSSVLHSQCSNIFFSKTAGPIKAKFYVEPPWVGGTKVCSRHLGHMTKMPSMPIYGKNP